MATLPVDAMDNLQTAQRPENNSLLTATQLARRWRISPNTLRAMRENDKSLPFVENGRLILYQLSDIEAYETAHGLQPTKEARGRPATLLTQEQRQAKTIATYFASRRAAPTVQRWEAQWLRKKGRVPAAQALADKLEGCKPGARCGSGACRVCSVRAQGYVAQGIRHLAAEKTGIFFLTVVPAKSTVAVGGLNPEDHANHERRLKRTLKETGVEWLIGGTDLSLNEHKNGRYEPHWCPHLHAMGKTDDLERLKAWLKEAFHPTEAIFRAVKATAWDGNMAAPLYVLKPDFERRHGYYGEQCYDSRRNEFVAACNTRKQKLRSAERLELLLYLEQLGIQSRVFCYGIQVHAQRHRYELRLTANGKLKHAD